jgi:molybdopterin biosynthesis enzyme
MPLKGQDSGALLDLSHATALLRRPAGSPPATAGDMIDILTL